MLYATLQRNTELCEPLKYYLHAHKQLVAG